MAMSAPAGNGRGAFIGGRFQRSIIGEEADGPVLHERLLAQCDWLRGSPSVLNFPGLDFFKIFDAESIYYLSDIRIIESDISNIIGCRMIILTNVPYKSR